jgi:uncharacterized protein YcsI (UPF0317 family)
LRVCKYEILEEVERDESEIDEPYYSVYTNGECREDAENDSESYHQDYEEEDYDEE